MTDDKDLKAIVRSLDILLAQNREVMDKLIKDNEEHESQHRYLAAAIEREERRRDFWKKTFESLVAKGVFATLAGLAFLFFLGAKSWVVAYFNLKGG